MGDLQSAQNATVEQGMGRKAGDVLAFEEDAPAAGPLGARNHVEDRGLAGSVRANQAGDAPRLDFEAAAPHGLQAPEVLFEVFDFKHIPPMSP